MSFLENGLKIRKNTNFMLQNFFSFFIYNHFSPSYRDSKTLCSFLVLEIKDKTFFKNNLKHVKTNVELSNAFLIFCSQRFFDKFQRFKNCSILHVQKYFPFFAEQCYVNLLIYYNFQHTWKKRDIFMRSRTKYDRYIIVIIKQLRNWTWKKRCLCFFIDRRSKWDINSA